MQTNMRLFNESYSHYFLITHHQENDTSECLHSRRCKNTVKMQMMHLLLHNDFNKR